MPLYDYECAAHGKFESLVGKCPHGCGAGLVKRLPVLKLNTMGGAAKNTDKLAQGMMDSFGITDMRPSQGTPAMSATHQPPRWNQPEVLAGGVPRSVPYAVPLDAKQDVLQQGASLGARPEEVNPLVQMKNAGMLQHNVNVIYDDKRVITKRDIENADTR